MGLKDKLNAAIERGNAGRVAKLGAKSEKAFEQGNVVKGIKLKAKEVKVGARGEKREAIGLAKKAMKIPVVQPYKKEGINTLKQVMSEKTRKQIPADISNKLMEYQKINKNK